MEQTDCDLILFGQKTAAKALYSKGWKALRWLVRMRSAVQICSAAPEQHLKSNGFGCFLCFATFERIRFCGFSLTT